jgi:hypothetical protein
VPSSAPRIDNDIVSSRTSRKGAGWGVEPKASPADLYRPGRGRVGEQFSWITPRPLWDSRNDKIARWLGDSTNEERERWVEAQRRAGVDIDQPLRDFEQEAEVSFLVLGDPGEGDDSQYQVLRPLLSQREGICFTYIVSDVIYPAGDAADYYDNFFWPYRELPGPIYAVPGNHDWYDGLHGFMTQLCNANPDLRPPIHPSTNRFKRAFLDLTWREPTETPQVLLDEMRQLRRPSGQHAPYFAIELNGLLLVGLDTGIQSGIDAKQGEWLKRISKRPKDKILLTGKPLVVDARRKTCPIAEDDSATVNSIVDDPDNRYIAVIGGDIHNFQRYPVRQQDGRVIQHIVSGAAGAYTKATHRIPKATSEHSGCDEKDFRCYPLRGDSLAAYSILLNRKIPLDLAIDPEVTSELTGVLLGDGLRPKRAEDRDKHVSPEDVRKARKVLFFSDAKILGPLSKNFSEFLDWNKPNPPLFKSFLRVDTRPGEIEIRCFGVTGCEEHADNPPLEDHIKGTRVGDGRWTWDVLLD